MLEVGKLGVLLAALLLQTQVFFSKLLDKSPELLVGSLNVLNMTLLLSVLSLRTRVRFLDPVLELEALLLSFTNLVDVLLLQVLHLLFVRNFKHLELLLVVSILFL